MVNRSEKMSPFLKLPTTINSPGFELANWRTLEVTSLSSFNRSNPKNSPELRKE